MINAKKLTNNHDKAGALIFNAEALKINKFYSF